MGALTLPLAAAGAPILAIEIDQDLVADLARRVPANVTLMSGDFLDVDVLPFMSGLDAQRPAGWSGPASPARRRRIVGNIPYGVSSPILFKLLDIHRRHGFFADATVMLQREVADRLLAKPGTKDYGVLTVLTTLHATVTRLLDLPPGAFRPPPKVRSTVVRLIYGPASARVSDEARFERLVRTMFMQRRKTLANALKPVDVNARRILADAGFDGRRRPETLQVKEIARLAELFPSVPRTPVL
jgi:16S rRNA (adenine1518-N6/adenine1519-N6)-dimethyltransferase